MKSNYTFNLKTNTIILSRSFENLLNSGDVSAYRTLQTLQSDFPQMAINYAPKMKRKSKTQITYKKMVKYIKCFRDSETYLAEFDRIREASKAQPSPYTFVRDWFYATFPTYKKINPDFDENGKIIMPKDELSEKRQEKETSTQEQADKQTNEAEGA